MKTKDDGIIKVIYAYECYPGYQPYDYFISLCEKHSRKFLRKAKRNRFMKVEVEDYPSETPCDQCDIVSTP